MTVSTVTRAFSQSALGNQGDYFTNSIFFVSWKFEAVTR